jgi:23S rRNA (cytosine1962-C5)-methyltransferase
MAGIVVKPRARILHGHDWVFSSEVLKVFGNPTDGDVISLKDGKDRLIGSAIYNSKSQIVARRFSRRRQVWIPISLGAELRNFQYRDPKLRRVVWAR